MKVLVTGAAGFIGSNACPWFLDKGFEVVGIDNFDPYYSRKVKEFNMSDFINNKLFKFIEMDIRNKDELEKLFNVEKFDAVFHLAALAGVTYSVNNPDPYIEVNYMGTNHLAEFSSKYNVKSFVFASTSSVYGENNTPPYNETMATDRPEAPYPATKKACELLLWSYHRNFELNVTIFRFFNPIGPKMRPDLALPKLIRSAEYGEVFKQFFKTLEESARDYVSIIPMLEAVTYAIEHPFKYEIMNLGNSDPVTLGDFFRTVESITGKEINKVVEVRPGQMQITNANVDKARKLVNYNPRYKINETVKMYYDWYMKQPEWYRKAQFEFSD